MGGGEGLERGLMFWNNGNSNFVVMGGKKRYRQLPYMLHHTESYSGKFDNGLTIKLTRLASQIEALNK